MQRITIENFGAIQSADIEVKKVLVLIGEQASGKSTIAKLIYFFKSLKDDLFSQIYSNPTEFEVPKSLILLIREKFYDFFGSTFHLPNFHIKYYYDVERDKYLHLYLEENKKLLAQCSPNMLSQEVKTNFATIKNLLHTPNTVQTQLIYEQNKLKYAQKLSELINNLFNNSQTDLLYVIAGRNATVTYSELFEKYLFATIQNSIEANRKQASKRKTNTIEEFLMLEFIEKISKIKDAFRKFGGFEGLIETYVDGADRKAQLYDLKQQIDHILKGEYTIDGLGEKIIFNELDNSHVILSNASSGQQESIRILQDIFMAMLDNLKVFRIIEEPEAHLFPVAQKQLIELLCLLVNDNVHNQIVITTHSPYVLSVFNNLLFAARVVRQNPAMEQEVSAIVPKKYHINAADFAAYALGNSGTTYCKSIVDNQLIDQNYLDEVSEMLGEDFNDLYALHATSFART
jgi:predicted ATPase